MDLSKFWLNSTCTISLAQEINITIAGIERLTSTKNTCRISSLNFSICCLCYKLIKLGNIATVTAPNTAMINLFSLSAVE